ncbi:cation diffusion facilitator family transporter [Propionibacterium cyclohexanicum]|uniref:Cation diffusion facilitator family transporter n=1 Tax=Propionibacterium cyclohexanicum TaxID=64702 RepID=A0A1H9QDN1_9ACTN|nr:cation diffusion facilitator family transporter [Propionibacterium cyclohexanicum]SER58574.1 cation diffusion facilitator family transporter [Propionibacterium cyclohexanicum]
MAPGKARSHRSAHPTRGATRATVAALAANLAIALTKFLAWLLTGASSMLSEAIHSFADTGNEVLLLLGGRSAKRGPNSVHPFGFGRQRYINAFLVSIILFSVGGLFALYETGLKIAEVLRGEPDELLASSWWWVPLVVLGLSLVAESVSLRTALRETHSAREQLSIAQFVHESRAPELPVVLLEDSAALAGLVFALLGVGLTLLTGNGLFDALGAGMIGLLLIAVAVLLGVEMQSLLLGESATPQMAGVIAAALTSTPGIEAVIHMKTVHVGPEQVLVAAKIAVAPTQSAGYVSAVIDAAERNIREAEPMCTYVYLEPDIRRAVYRAARGIGSGN